MAHPPPRKPALRYAAWVAALLLLLGAGRVVPVAGETSGVLAPPHADAGVDTNGDKLYNYLQLTVSLQIFSGGKFTVQVILNDSLDLAVLTQNSVSLYLNPGSQKVQVLLDGADIYNGGVPGPFYAHLTLLSDYRTVLSKGVYLTAAYSYSSFQPYDARFVPPAAERTIDNDSDGLIDWISLGFTIDVATGGTYTLSSYLQDSSHTVTETWTQSPQLAPGRYSLQQLFLAYPLRLALKSGPYLVASSLYDSRGALVDFAFIQTAAYNYTSLEGPPVKFTSPYSENAEDTNGNGLYNDLKVNVGLAVDNAGTYILRGRLSTSAGQLIQAVEYRLNLVSGLQTASLFFMGSSIYTSGTNGPYRADLELYDVALRRLDAYTYWTKAYAYTNFEPKILGLAPPHGDQGVDFDGDGKFDALRLLVYVDVGISVQVRVDAGILNPLGGVDLARASKTTLLPTGLQTVGVDFSGSALLASGVEGPYRMWIAIYDSKGALLDQGGHRSFGYSLTDFEAGVQGRVMALRGDVGEDVDANGYYNRLRVHIDVNVSLGGRYRIDGSLLKGSAHVSDAQSNVQVAAGASTIDLTFAGPDIRAAGLDGPYYLQANLWMLSGPSPMDYTILATSTYSAASFEQAAVVNLSGQVISDSWGAPLANATVWLLDYGNSVSRQTRTDAQGYYFLQAYAGTYNVIVDHPNGEAKVWRRQVTGNTVLGVSLRLPLRATVQGSLTWAGWDTLVASVRYVYSADAAALRYQLDWVEGNRDGWVEPWEAALVAQPADRLWDVIDGGSSQGHFSLNDVYYRAAGNSLWTDGVSGPVDSSQIPYQQVARAFISSSLVGRPAQVHLSLDTYYDSATLDRSLALLLPGSYRFASFNDTFGVNLYGRAFPMVVDPEVDPTGQDPPGVVNVQIALGLRASYVPPRPSAPDHLAASGTNGIASLAWSRPNTNLDGSRIANLAGYYVYRSPSSSGPFVRVSSTLVMTEGFTDPCGPGIYYYEVSAVNTDGVEGPMSSAPAVTVAL